MIYARAWAVLSGWAAAAARKRMTPLLMAAILAACAAGAAASDLPRIDRSLVREPKYLDKPRYFLLVFGPEARTRVWCVLDGSTLYVDRNGDGNLTDPGERFTLTFDRPIEVGDITRPTVRPSIATSGSRGRLSL